MIVDLDKLGHGTSFGTSGSGQQIKIWVTKNNKLCLVKINSKYREGSKEQSVSRFLTAAGINHIDCECKSFLIPGESVVPLYSLIEDIKVRNNQSAVELFNNVIEYASRGSGISRDDIIKYLILQMTIDYIVMNKDRHFNNISFIET